ncbi:MAG: type III pantothenate kinase [Chitinophagales bacterium]|nr:type III pantothenate kinase [Bacteroidota bacterium]MCB9255732.1 type III pantothenate kinase [Chitinophagales bacterium]
MNCIVDRGNTKTKIYFFEKNDLKASLAFMNEEEDAILKALQNDFDKILVSASGNLPNFLVQLRSDQINLSSSTALPIRLNYSSLESLGSDRIALSVGAAFLYPQRNVLVVSAGTCITYDLLDEAGVFQGGLIAPGAAIRLKSLHEYTYSLPSLTFEPKENVPLIGKTTKECMESGVYNGIKAELSAIIQTFNENYKDLTVIITGGDGILFDFHMKNKIFAQQNLQAIGLNRILLYNAS